LAPPNLTAPPQNARSGSATALEMYCLISPSSLFCIFAHFLLTHLDLTVLEVLSEGEGGW